MKHLSDVTRNTQVLHQKGMNKDYSNIILDVKDLCDVTVAPSVGQCKYKRGVCLSNTQRLGTEVC